MPRAYEVPTDLNPYQVLDVREDASLEEIRKSFKRLVLKAHPDKNPDRREWSEKQVRELFLAFDLIGDSEKRLKYDAEAKRHQARPQRKQSEGGLFFFRKQDPECLALRVLYFLMHRRGQEAVDLVSSLERQLGPDFLQSQLDRADHLDCLFLLGEYLMKRKRYPDAFRRFLQLYNHQKSPRTRRPSYPLTVESLKVLCLRYLPRVLPPCELVKTLQGLPDDIAWTSREDARLALLLAEAFAELGDDREAKAWGDRAYSLDPQWASVRRWQAKNGSFNSG